MWIFNSNTNPVSIHAPRAGRDRFSSTSSPACKSFNPRAPRGARPGEFVAVVGEVQFQSTRPARGATTTPAETRPPALFQSTRPARGATGDFVAVFGQVQFQSTRPARGATGRVSAGVVVGEFQSTRPARGATNGLCGSFRRCPCFNPRAPRGARHQHLHQHHRAGEFQSTRPARGATRTGWRRVGRVRVSIHAPRAGRDSHRYTSRHRAPVSIHAPRAGRDGLKMR